jgi:hypothetical protein
VAIFPNGLANTVAGSGDFLCQWLIDGVSLRSSGDDELSTTTTTTTTTTTSAATTTTMAWDRARTGRFALLGCVLVAPAIHVWYGTLARWIPGTNAMAIAQRVALDQLFFTPIFLPAWLVSLWTLEEQLQTDNNAYESETGMYAERLIECVPDIYVANLALWVPVMALNFRFVPVKFQVLCSNTVALVWNMFLSFTTSR